MKLKINLVGNQQCKELKRMVEFNEERRNKYSCLEISGTGYLAYRDIKNFSFVHEVNFLKVLDLGCGCWLVNDNLELARSGA